jgi:hypothetical protein
MTSVLCPQQWERRKRFECPSATFDQFVQAGVPGERCGGYIWMGGERSDWRDGHLQCHVCKNPFLRVYREHDDERCRGYDSTGKLGDGKLVNCRATQRWP